MNNAKKYLLGLLALITVFSTVLPVQAAETKNNTKSAAVTAPIIFEGDDLSFSDATGEVFAKGNVKIQKDQTLIQTEELRGNTKESTVWVDGSANLTQPGVNLVGTGVEYNYKIRSGLMNQAKGKVGHEFVAAHNISMTSEELVLHDGTITRCPAKVPDYHISADKIEVWPGDKMIAYNAKFWIKDKMIFSIPKYQKSIKENARSESDFPQLGYTSKDGAYIIQHLEYPVSNDTAAFVNLAYYTKSDFKPNFGLKNSNGNYSMSLSQGYFRDDDDNWIKKEPELRVNFGEKIGQSPFNYSVGAVYGKWVDNYKTSWHQDYSIYFSRDPIEINHTTKLYLGTGFEWVQESYNKSTQEIFRYDAVVTKEFAPRFSSWVGYHYYDKEMNLFDYDVPDLNKQLDVGFHYKIDKMNAITFNQSYDMENHQIFDQDYTWNRDLHCWQVDITYRAKRGELKWLLTTKQW
ncbi:LPS-assembly protein LptD [Sporomusaceae bacterium FL31]|nr:LPS-assembly protein LptD [Sporomusaceae bacterium FL31]GCE33927.1 LPS-assembly protein LptD [Sporomusaceae bacterium]